MVIFVYFENIVFNIILIIGLISLSSLINFILNKHARFLMKYTSSLKMNSLDIVTNYSKDKNIKLESYPSKAGNELDCYVPSNNYIFINARHYFSSSLYTLSRTLYFCSMSEVYKKNPKAFKFQNKCDSIFTLSDVLSYGLLMVGILLKMNILIIISLVLFLVSIIFAFINLKTIKEYQEIAKKYLSKVTKDKNEVKIISVIYQFELYQYTLRPFLSVVKIIPFLASINQKKLGMRENYYED